MRACSTVARNWSSSRTCWRLSDPLAMSCAPADIPPPRALVVPGSVADAQHPGQLLAPGRCSPSPISRSSTKNTPGSNPQDWCAGSTQNPSPPTRPSVTAANDDLNLLLRAAQAAWDGRRGAWAEFGETLLLGYEYRACIKLGVQELDDPASAIAEACQRHCMHLRDLRLVAGSTTSRSHQASGCGSGRTTLSRPVKTSTFRPNSRTDTPVHHSCIGQERRGERC
jgi:hypothetical protein